MTKQNCWEATNCGREPGGVNVSELGVCPAATDTSSDGINGGKNGGRLCWAISGTFCGGIVQGTRAAKRLTCLHCDFFDRVMREEGSGTVATSTVIETGQRRMRLAALVIAAAYLIYTAVLMLVGSGAQAGLHLTLGGIGVGACLALVWGVGRGSGDYHKSAVLAFGYLSVMLLLWAISEHATLDPGRVSTQMSLSCVLLLVFPFLLPIRPKTVLLGSLVAASLALLAYPIGVAVGLPAVENPWVVVSRWVPLFGCALVAYLPARVLGGLARDVKRARRLGSYELVELIGVGGMGEVWRARHRMLARPAAVKLIRGSMADTQRSRERFEREAQATATLESPHTVELYDFGIAEDGAFYYVMELLRGIDIDTLVARFGPQPAERVVHVLQQVCDSLADAHRIGLVHRDVKPSNIYLAVKGGRVDFAKVLDFGLVKVRRNVDDVGATAEGVQLGTPGYMAPEMVLGDTVGGAADIYALGCVAYWMLTGEAVFAGSTPMRMVLHHVNSDPVPPSQRTENPIPEALEQLVLTCLSKNPAKRPSAAELEVMLSQMQQGGQQWTREQASRWWRIHLPNVLAGSCTVVSPGLRATQTIHPL